MSAPDAGGAKAVTSLANPTVKMIRALALAKNRRASGLFLGEGPEAVATAIEADWPIRILVYSARLADEPRTRRLARLAAARGAELLAVSDPVLAKMTRRDNPQPVMGVFRQRLCEPGAIRPGPDDVWVALEGVRDPGNLGTVIRTVDAVGARGTILVGETVDPFSLEAVRATSGAIFRVPLARMSLTDFLAWRRRWPGTVAGTHLHARTDYRKVDYRGPVLLVMGTEQSGLSPTLAKSCDILVRIPMAGRAESLNLAVATGIMLFEIRRGALRL